MIKKAGITLIHAVDDKFGTDLFSKLIQLKIGFHTPYYWFSRKQIAFIHLPKTAGTSLHTLLGEDTLHRFVNLNAHRPVSRFCPPDRYRYITVMRHPVDRVWSNYQMLLRTPNIRNHHMAQKGLDCFLENYWYSRNMACRYYAGNVRKEPDEQTLERARSNLSKFLYIFWFDSIEENIRSFLEEYGIPTQPTIPHKRKITYSQPAQEERDLIASFNTFDIALYDEFKTAPDSTRL